ncbi:DUF3592 domain-containing protein [Pseudomonadota bacterium]
MSSRKRKSNIVGSIACVVFALLALAFGFSMSMQVQRMESIGIHADASVTGVKTGAKNSKTAIVAFKTVDGVDIESKCMFMMFAIRHKTGDQVAVLYDPSEPKTVMIDNGIWNWDQPAFGILGGLILFGLAVLILRSWQKQHN